jgi:hypothetical protein
VNLKKLGLSVAVSALVLASGAAQSSPIRYDFTAEGNTTGYFTYDDTAASIGSGPFAGGGKAYAAQAFSINGVNVLNPILILYNDYGFAGNDFLYVTNMSADPYLQLSGDFLNDDALTSFGFSHVLDDFSGFDDNALYGAGPGGFAMLLTLDGSTESHTVPEPATLSLVALGVAGAVVSRRRKKVATA